MKNFIRKLLFLGAPLLIASCYDNTTPTNVLKSVGVAVQKSDMKNYPTFFTGRALSQYGNAQGMEVLRSKGVSDKLKLGRENLISETSHGPRAWSRIWGIDIFGADRLLARSQVTCNSEVRREYPPDRCYTECYETERGQFCRRTCDPNFPEDVTYTSCAVSDLRF